MEKKIPKVLIITSAPIRSNNNIGKTLIAMLSGFKKSELAELYFNPILPNVDFATKYYRVNEKQIIKSCFGLRKKECGGEVYPILSTKNMIGNSYNLTKYKNSLPVRLIREFLWDRTAWKNNSLKQWLDEVKPNVIFTTLQDINSLIKAVDWIADYTNCFIVLFVTDDYYNDPLKSNNIFRKNYYKTRQKLDKRLAKRVKVILGCSNYATIFFRNCLNICGKCETVYTPTTEYYLSLPLHKQSKRKLVIRYFGNMSLGRWEILEKLGKTLQTINVKNKKAILEVYSAEENPEAIEALTIPNCCTFKGYVAGDEYACLLQSADITVHVESFDYEIKNRTWLSVSTKIADYLGAGKCILAIGPRDLASMEHLKGASCVVDDLSKLKKSVEGLLLDSKLRSEFQIKARELALEYHDINKIKEQVRNAVENASSEIIN